MRRLLLGVFIFFMLFVPAAAFAGAATTAVDALILGGGSRAAGMAEAFCAIADDPSAFYWNPAGLAFQKFSGVTFSYDQRGAIFNDFNASYSLIGYTQSIDSLGTFGLATQLYNKGTIIVTDSSNNVLGSIDLGMDLVVALTYSDIFFKNLGVGVNLKYIDTRLSDFYITKSYAVDAGVMYKSSYKDIKVAAVLQNLGPDIPRKDAAQSDPLPRNLKLGASIKLLERENSVVTGSADASKPVKNEKDITRTDNISLSAGAELVFGKVLIGRVGYTMKEGGIKGLSYGFGVRFRWLQIDYANFPLSTDYSASNFSFTMFF